MVYSTQKLFAAASLLSTAASHMIMQTPVPFNPSTIDTSPLGGGGGGAFPCKLAGDPSTFYKTDNRTSMAIGESQKLSFKGSAVHGGGSCQLAITHDKEPSISSSWKVILSIEGGCPTTDGNGPSEYKYQIPEGIETGDAVLAWTWISLLAGQNEYYMNCAPITITGGSGTSQNTVEKRDTFPELFVANLPAVNDCQAGMSDVVYPNPGPDSRVQKPKSSALHTGTITGTNCVPKGLTDGGSGGGDAGGSTSSTTSATVVVPTTATLPSTTASGGSTTAVSSLPITTTDVSSISATTSGLPGFTNSTITATPISIPLPSSSSGSNSTATQAPPPPPPLSPTSGQAQPTTLQTRTSAASSSSPSTTQTPSAGQLSGSCTTEGQWNCVSSTSATGTSAGTAGFSFQRCASGSWTGMTPLSVGEKCTVGLSMTLWRRGGSVREF